jgi:hypothetical protein
VDKYSFVRIDNGFYSVPDHLVRHTLTVKAYPEKIAIYSGLAEVCRHKRLASGEEYRVEILHYLDTLTKKPGAVKNSVALRLKKRLKDIFDERYADSPKDFIVQLVRYKDLPIDKIAEVLISEQRSRVSAPDRTSGTLAGAIQKNTRKQLAAYSAAFLKAGDQVAC